VTCCSSLLSLQGGYAPETALKRRLVTDSPESPCPSGCPESEDAHVKVSDDPRVGTELAGDRIESLLGFGGMKLALSGGPGIGREASRVSFLMCPFCVRG
jgi:hypothetical protein